MEWTTGEEETLRECGHLGVERVRQELLCRYGRDRTTHSIEAHASRIHVSLRRQEVCPECGAIGVRLNRQTGMCRRCSTLFHLREEVAYNEILERERLEAAGGDEVEEARREYDAMRQRNSRLRRRYHLASGRPT